MSFDETTTTLVPEQTRGDAVPSHSAARTRRLLSTAGAKVASATAPARAAVPEKVRAVPGKVRAAVPEKAWLPTLAGTVAVVGATAAVILRRRRVAQARAAQNRWRPGFLKR